ncbi:regucalcin-like isoform X2 [Episyrphus balteatus]|nr:regucalcin-like isoform X2 [Episyrphus balteatus]XP_055843251.1 regucalcin-like isoform X2 [Episyrphus balteatus]XP_055843252.1 regucalcin-like isoform X2 [Episyrphus balteatus]
MSYKVEPLPDSFAGLGEGPHWDVATQSLYMVDLPNGKIMRYDFNENKMYRCQIENEQFASFIIPVEGHPDKFAVGTERRIVIVKWDGLSATCKVEKTILTVEQSDKHDNNRFNDAKCDPRGRLFGGTMHKTAYSSRTGNFYRLLKTDAHELLKTDVGISNGLAWNEKAKKFYYIDSEDFEVKEYDYDVNTGEIKNPKVLLDLHNMRGDGINLIPDGMTIDSEGSLYVATFNGSAVFKIDPNNGKILMEIKLPCEQITSAAFGGPNLDILYVTTAAANEKPLPNGTTYKITGLGVKGLPMTKLKLED